METVYGSTRGVSPTGDLSTNAVPVTNYVAWQWYQGTNVLKSQTNDALVLHRARVSIPGRTG